MREMTYIQARYRPTRSKQPAIKATLVKGDVIQLLGGLMAFPVKKFWWQKADLVTIANSVRMLRVIAESMPDRDFILPRPGYGAGGVTWLDVRPLMVELPDNVIVVRQEL